MPVTLDASQQSLRASGAHRQRLVGLEQAQHVRLHGGELELGGHLRDAPALRHEQAEQQGPGFACVIAHAPIIITNSTIFDNLNDRGRLQIMDSYLLIPLEDAVVFPNMSITLPIDVGDEQRVLLVPTHEGEYAKVGVVAEVTERARLPRGVTAVSLNALHRAVLGAAETDPSGRLRVAAEQHVDDTPAPVKTRELEREYRAVVEEKLELRGDDGRVAAFLRSITDAGALADSAGYSPDCRSSRSCQLLEELDVVERLRLAAGGCSARRWPRPRSGSASATTSRSGAQKQQREYFLRKQMDSIRKELGEDDASVIDEYRAEDRRGRHARRGARAGRARAVAGWSAWATSPARRR